MLVDRDNFAQASEQIQKLLKQNIKYIGFDLEMTGIKGDFDEFQYDLPFERFGRNKIIAQKFKIIQLGLTFFNQLKDNHFEAYARPPGLLPALARAAGLRRSCPPASCFRRASRRPGHLPQQAEIFYRKGHSLHSPHSPLLIGTRLRSTCSRRKSRACSLRRCL